MTDTAHLRSVEDPDWSDLEDDIADAIMDSMDMDWTCRDGARAVISVLKARAARQALTQEADPNQKGIIYLTPRDIRGRYLLMERIRRTLTRR